MFVQCLFVKSLLARADQNAEGAGSASTRAGCGDRIGEPEDHVHHGHSHKG
jgi:hypothetical protein